MLPRVLCLALGPRIRLTAFFEGGVQVFYLAVQEASRSARVFRSPWVSLLLDTVLHLENSGIEFAVDCLLADLLFASRSLLFR